MKSKKFYTSMILMMIALFVAVLPAFAAKGAVVLGYTLNAEECYVDIRVQVEDAGYYAVNVWDDGDYRAGAGTDASANSTVVVRLYIGGSILGGAPGIGVYVGDAAGMVTTETYYSDGSAVLWDDSVGMACATGSWSAAVLGADCSSPLPSNSAIYEVPAGALAFHSPNTDAYTGFNLPAGSWYITNFTEDFAKVWISCEAAPIYIPVENVLR